VFVATRSGMGDGRSMVAEAWDLATVEEQYKQFVAEFSARDPSDVLVRQLELVHAGRRFPSVDPALPRELLPSRWTGVKAARLFSVQRERWSAAARHEWERLNVG
jgi:phenylacetic acid degradation operon negative regulatory protein